MNKSYLLLIIYFMTAGFTLNAQEQKPVINHLALHVHNFEKSVKFYEEVMGLDTVPEPFHDGNHKWFSIGTATLHLIGKAAEPVVRSKQTHLCFSVPSVTEFTRRLANAKVAYEDLQGRQNAVTTRVDGVKQIYFKDPDGYWIEINDAKN